MTEEHQAVVTAEIALNKAIDAVKDRYDAMGWSVWTNNAVAKAQATLIMAERLEVNAIFAEKYKGE